MAALLSLIKQGRLWLRMALAACCCLWLGSGLAQTAEEELKVAYIFNFLKLTEWPETQNASPMDICVAGRDPFDGAFAILQDHEVQQKPIHIRFLEGQQKLADCRLLFIPGQESSSSFKSWLRAAAGTPVLTVSDSPGFIDEGGMIGLVAEDNKLRFEVNLAMARQNQINLSAQLLQLAIRVEGVKP